MLSSEALRGEARAGASDDHRPLQPDRLHERHDVRGELLDLVTRGRAIGVAVTPLGHREGVDRPREMWQHALERPPRVANAWSKTTGTPDRSPCST
jgi:hypothetical protein